MVPGRPDQALERPVADHRHVVRRARTQPHAQLLDLELAHPRHRLMGITQQLIGAAHGRTQLEAALLHGRTEHVAAVRPRHQVAAAEPHHAPQQPRPGGIAQAQDLSLHRAHRHARGGGQAVELAAPGTRGDHSPRGGEGAPAPIGALQLHPGELPSGGVQRQPEDRRALAQLHAGLEAGLPQRGKHHAGVHRVVVGRLQGQTHPRRQSRLTLACLARAQAAGRQAERVAEGRLPVELARLVLVAGDQQGAGPHQPHPHARGRLQLRRERGPQVRRAQPQLQQAPPVLAELGLGHRRQHAGGDVRGSPAGLPALEHRHRQPAAACLPRDRQPDDAGADDDHVGALGSLRHALMLEPPVGREARRAGALARKRIQLADPLTSTEPWTRRAWPAG